MAFAVLGVGASCMPIGCTDNRATTSTTSAEQELEVRRGDLQPRFLVTGELQAVNAVDIKVPQNPNWQVPIRWMADDGAEVATGDRVLEFDNSELVSNLEQQELAWLQAANDLATVQADVAVAMADKAFELEKQEVALEKARIKAEVPEELQERRDYQEAQLELERTRIAHSKAVQDLSSYQVSSDAEIEVLRIALRKAKQDALTAREAIDALTVHAPSDGILVVAENPREDRKFQVGDNGWVGLTVMRIPRLDAWKVVGYLSDVDDGRITPGMKATCVLDSYPDQEFTGTVSEITPIAQERGRRSLRRAFRATILLDQADAEKMRPGMSVKVAVRPDPIEDVLLIPRAALDLSAEPPRARLADGSDVDVSVQFCDEQSCILESGLKAGQRLGRAG